MDVVALMEALKTNEILKNMPLNYLNRCAISKHHYLISYIYQGIQIIFQDSLSNKII